MLLSQYGANHHGTNVVLFSALRIINRKLLFLPYTVKSSRDQETRSKSGGRAIFRQFMLCFSAGVNGQDVSSIGRSGL
jgi:hypothetical protein